MEVIEEFFSNVILFFINYLSCHVVTFQGSIRFSYGCFM